MSFNPIKETIEFKSRWENGKILGWKDSQSRQQHVVCTSTWKCQFSSDHCSQAMLNLVSTWNGNLSMDCCLSTAVNPSDHTVVGLINLSRCERCQAGYCRHQWVNLPCSHNSGRHQATGYRLGEFVAIRPLIFCPQQSIFPTFPIQNFKLSSEMSQL